MFGKGRSSELVLPETGFGFVTMKHSPGLDRVCHQALSFRLNAIEHAEIQQFLNDACGFHDSLTRTRAVP